MVPEKQTLVLKFGGTSVSNFERWQQIINIIKQRLDEGYKVAIVHSAKSGITNLLEKFCEKPDLQLISEIQDSIQQLAKELKVNADLQTYLARLQSFASKQEITFLENAEILSYGELMTHEIVSEFLGRYVELEKLNPKKIFISSKEDNRSQATRVLSAKCDILATTFSASCAIMPGFIASDNEGNTVVLGRGGSDTSASYLAVALKASRIEIWTDVHGIFSANPHVVPTARLIEKIGYEEAREIAASGGKVLHPRCILPAEQNSIPLHICNTMDPKANGTILKKGYESTSPRVRAINVRHKITLISMDSINMWHQAGFMGRTFGVFRELGISIDIVVTAQTNITVSLDTADNVINNELLEELKSRLSEFCDVTIYKNCSAVTLVGYRMRALLGQIAPIISNFSEQRIYLTSQSSNDLNTSVVVEEDQADKLLIALHDGLIAENANQYGFGPTWEQLISNQTEKAPVPVVWWQNKKNELLQVAQQNSPCYVYDKGIIEYQISLLKSLTAIDKIFFAMKSNFNSDVMNTIYSHGMGIETVSPGEISHAQKHIKNIENDRILFTPNFAPIEEYQNALDKGLHVTIDNMFILQQHPEVFAGHSILLRLDPGHGDGHHRYVRTAGEHSKFGIPESELQTVKEICRQHQIKIKGLHAHAGSGILDHLNWERIVSYLTEKTETFTDVQIINIGGGMGIAENPYEQGLDMSELDNILLFYKNQYPHLQFWMEPGRFLVANAGVLLAKVTQTKVKGDKGYIGLETGMNSLIRPALYGAWHNIVNLSRIDEELDITATVVGPICETGDILGVDRKLPETQPGDVFLIANCGAYGYSMASRYNLREPAEEIFLK